MKKYGCDVTHLWGPINTLCGKTVTKTIKLSHIEDISKDDILCPECQEIWDNKVLDDSN